ncbi:MAG: C-GCAxxG-C-C family protein [Deltaproteobacteria bacterium]|nr:C-GCAxxG-C-C family protein [Deltaproteobacteria bacterium]
MATGFHGGGGRHMEAASEKPEDLRHPAYAIPEAAAKLTNTGSLCGALAAGVMMIGYLFGRRRPEDDITCASELSFELHKRFLETLGSKTCSVLKPFHFKISEDPSQNLAGNCGKVYYAGAKLAVEVILSASEICPLCPEAKLPVLQGCLLNL